MTPEEVYDYGYRVKNALQRLQSDPQIRPEDRRLILSLHRHLKAKKVSLGRQAKYLNHLIRCAQLISVPFRKAKTRHMEELMVALADYEIARTRKNGKKVKTGRHYSPATMSDFSMIIKTFMKFVRYGDTERETAWPDEVRWIKEGVKQDQKRTPLFLTDAEAESMISSAVKDRDKAFIALGHELGLRVSENLLLKVGDIEFDDAGALVRVRKGKTGPRTLRAIACLRHLTNYLEKHPYRKDPEAPLWLTSSSNHLNRPFSWVAASRMIKQVAALAGVKKERIHIYMMRHGSATRNSKHLSDQQLKLMYGWSRSSRMLETYVHLSGGDLDEAYQQLYASGKPVEPPKPSFSPVVCPRCGDKASPGMRFCPKCASPLDRSERAKMAVQEEETRNEIAELRKLVEKSLSPPASAGGPGSSPGRNA
ncbi:MAG: tyrosine-type recombinase/integrase [Nitrososphaerota archaeon]|nr:tyrosine-type recombinase/integrase [Nitrososphaerota archaeon]MDG6991594.1 tyrosine-type recombinase/integrase [Nitrososphaerota archaeon]